MRSRREWTKLVVVVVVAAAAATAGGGGSGEAAWLLVVERRSEKLMRPHCHGYIFVSCLSLNLEKEIATHL